MKTYWEINYRYAGKFKDRPELAKIFGGDKKAYFAGDTEEEALDSFYEGETGFEIELLGKPIRRETTDEEWENG